MRLPLASLLALSLVSTAFAGKSERHPTPINAHYTLMVLSHRLFTFIDMISTTIDRCTTKNTDSHDCWHNFYKKMSGAMGGDTDDPDMVNPLISAATAGFVSKWIPEDWAPSPFPAGVDPIVYQQKEPSSNMPRQAAFFYRVLYDITLNGCSLPLERRLRASIASLLISFLDEVYGPDKDIGADDRLIFKIPLKEKAKWLRLRRSKRLHTAKSSK